MRQFVEKGGQVSPVMHRAANVFWRGEWKRQRREAEARNDFRMIDYLDKIWDDMEGGVWTTTI